jgi:hypothetical protein
LTRTQSKKDNFALPDPSQFDTDRNSFSFSAAVG